MNIESYKSDPLFLVERHVASTKNILKESCSGLTSRQKQIVEGIYNEFLPLIRQTALLEQTLTADEIKKLFTDIEQNATAAGGNRTALGQGKDVAAKAGEIVNNVGKWLQNTTPVKMADQKFEDLKAKIGAKFPELDKQLTGMGTWMKENPGKSAAVIGVLTALASLAGGPVGGAIAGQVLRGASELIKGEKLSSAVGKGLKTAAYGFMAGWLLDGLGDWLEGLRMEVLDYPEMPSLTQINVDLEHTLTLGNQTYTNTIYTAIVPEDYVENLQNLIDAARNGDIDAFDQIAQFTESFNVEDYIDTKNATDAMFREIVQSNDEFLQNMMKINDGITAAAQGAVAGKLSAGDVKVDGKAVAGENQKPTPTPTEALLYNLKPLSEAQTAYLFKRITETNHTMITEGVIWEAGNEPEGQKASFMQKVMGKAKDFGKNLTTKVTASKLMSAWKSEGSPADSDGLADFLKQQGVNDQVIADTYANMQLPPPGKGAGIAELAAIKKEIEQLGPKTRQQLTDFLSQRLGAA